MNAPTRPLGAPPSSSSSSPRSDWELAKSIARELSPQRALFTLAVVMYLPLTLMSVAQPLVIGRAVDQGMRAHDVAAVTENAAIFLALVAMRAVVEGLQGWWMQLLGQRAVRELRLRLFNKIQRLPMAYFDRTPLGKIMTRVTNDTETLAELFSSGAVSVVGDLLFLVATVVVLFSVDWRLSLATLATLPPLAVGVGWFRRRARVAFAQARAAMSQLNAALQELLSGMTMVRLFAQAPRARARFESENAAYLEANKDAIWIDAGVYAFVDSISNVAIALALAAAMQLGTHGADAVSTTASTTGAGAALTIGVLVAFVEALGRFFLPIRELSNKTTIFQSALVAADRIVELEAEPEEIIAPQAPVPVRFDRSIRFDDVRFSYGQGPEVLRGLSFQVNKGQRVALVGHTGAGKSTIIKLVPRLYDVTGGRILVDDVDLRAFDPHALRRLTTAVPQEVFLFQGTLRENLLFGRPGASDAEILDAARACEALDVLERHGGLDGTVAERAQNFSLGERQLLALTRALVSNPPILILDEATASVDRETERRLQKATETLIEGRTAIIVAHRLSTIERCDCIFVLHHGQLVEQGTHAELMAAGGRYAALVELQQRDGG